MNFNTTNVKAGEYLNGALMLSDDVIYLVSGSSGNVNKLRSNITPIEERIIVNVAKEIQREKVLKSHEEYLNTAFEYPLGSGDTYSMAYKYMPEYNALATRVASFNFPLPYGGNNGASIVFLTPLELDAFNAASLAFYETARNTIYVPKIAQINAVTLNPPTTTMEDAIAQIQAIVY